MESDRKLPNRVKSQRVARGWSQAELGKRAGISRTAVSAIEGQRLVPSVAGALALASVLECTVEDLFGSAEENPSEMGWAWVPPQAAWRYWRAEVGGRVLLYPIESAGTTASLPHDGRGDQSKFSAESFPLARKTLVVACCDPAAGLLSTLYAKASGLRLLAIPRSSQQALDLLAQGLVHVAGIHLSTDADDQNATVVRSKLGDGYKLLRVATWQEGLAISRGQNVSTIRSALKSRLRWVGREKGSGARQCMDELLPSRTSIRRIARDHRGVADAIRSGWADAGVCLRLTSAEAGLRFFPVREEVFEFCFSNQFEGDVRLGSLVQTVRSPEYRRLLADLPGYNSIVGGEIRCVT